MSAQETPRGAPRSTHKRLLFSQEPAFKDQARPFRGERVHSISNPAPPAQGGILKNFSAPENQGRAQGCRTHIAAAEYLGSGASDPTVVLVGPYRGFDPPTGSFGFDDWLFHSADCSAITSQNGSSQN